MATPQTGRTKTAIRAVPTTGGAKKAGGPPASVGDADYVVPVLQLHLSERKVNLAFWSTLAATAVLGILDLPVAVLVGGAVVVARHHARTAPSIPG